MLRLAGASDMAAEILDQTLRTAADVLPYTRHGAGRRPELRQLFARDRRLDQDAPLVFIEIGSAPQLRADCHAGDLVCPFPGCADSRLITRGGSRRDHFAHRHAADVSADEKMALTHKS